MNLHTMSFKVLSVSVVALLSGSAFGYDSTSSFDATADVQAALTVDCTSDVRFGKIIYRAANTAAIVTVAATAAGAASSNDASVIPVGGNGSAACTIANEGSDGTPSDATAALSGAGGTWTSPTLAGVLLDDGAAHTLSSSLTLSKTAAIGNETVYIGGALSIPTALAFAGVYTSSAVTLTVTD
ncbi:MAG: hypothetical protein ABI411_20725 [Tahibacter sp.]